MATEMTNQPWLIALLGACFTAGLVIYFQQLLQASMEEYAQRYATATSRHLADVFVFIPPRRILELSVSLAILGFTIAFMLVGGLSARGVARGCFFGLLAAWGGWQIPHHMLVILRRRRLRKFNEQLSDSLINMSNALKAGFSIPQAFESVVRNGQDPIAQEFSVFLHETRIGVRFEDALQHLKDRVGSEELTLMISAIETARLTGGNLTEVLEKIAFTIRERTRIERRIRTLTAMGRMQGGVVAALPVVLAIAMTFLDPRLMLNFFRSPLGLMIIGSVILLEGAGIALIRKIVKIDI